MQALQRPQIQISSPSAAARRFDTLVQTGTPSGSDWETGKTWLQNDADKTLSIWNGSSWLGVTSGTFTLQPKVVYVDATGGDDNNNGHRISTPKKTIKLLLIKSTLMLPMVMVVLLW